MFWILTAAMTAMVAAAILRPFLRNGTAVAAPAAAYDLGVYRDQLREVDRDVARGVLTETEAERLRVEIGRKILDADRAMARQAAPRTGGGGRWVAAGLLVAVLAASGALYGRLGNPALPDLPLAQRIAQADDRLDALPPQAEAETRASRRPAVQPDADYLRLIEQLRAAVAQRPDDARGLALLAEHEARLGNLGAARQAQDRLIALRGDQATSLDHARLAALMIEAAGGVVSAEAREQIEAALRIDPADGQARYLRGLMYAQNDRPDIAFVLWRDLLENGPTEAPWVAPIRQLIPDLAWLAGHPDYQPPEAAPALPGPALPGPALPGPDAQAMAAAGDMTPEEQQLMIAGMVRNLETRLADQGGTPEEWARLVTSLVRIGDEPHAREILTEARTRFAPAPEALSVIDAAAAGVGLSAP